MRAKGTLALLAVVVVLGLFILLYERRIEPSGSPYHRRIFPDLDEEAGKKVDRIEIDRPKDDGREKIVIEKREEDHWEIVEPVEYRADRYKATGIVSDLRFAEKREVGKGAREITAEEGKELKLADYGLDEESRAVIRLYAEGRLRCELSVGSKGITGENCYVQSTPGEAVVYVSDASLHTDATGELSAYRDKSVVLVKSSDVGKFVIGRPEDTLEFIRKEDVWEMTSPVKARTKTHDVQTTVNRFTSLKVEEFVEDGVKGEDLREYGLRPPEYSIVLTVKEKGEPTDRQILIGKVQGGKKRHRYCVRGGSDALFTIEFPSEQVTKKADEYRDSKLARVDPDDANRLTIEREGRRLAFSKVQYDWKINEPEERAGDADHDAIKKLLEDLRDAEIKDYLPPGAELTGGVTVTVGSKSEKKPEESFTVLKSGEKALAKRKGFDSVFAVDPELVEKLSRDILHFMSKKIYHVPTTDVVWIRIEKEGRVETAQCRDGMWVLAGTPGEIDADRVKNDIVWRLSDLYAEKLLGDVEAGGLDAYGLDEPWAKVTFRHKEKVTTDEGEKEEEKEVAVLFGSETEDGRRFAVLGGSKMVLEASASLVEGVADGLCKEKSGGEEEGQEQEEAEGG